MTISNNILKNVKDLINDLNEQSLKMDKKPYSHTSFTLQTASNI